MSPRPSMFAGLVGLLLLPVVTHAATIVAWDVPTLSHHSDLVVEATVLSVYCERLPDGGIQTRYELYVERYLKGDGPRRLDVLQVGGQIGEQVVVLWGDIQLRPGQRVVLFARGAPPEVHATLLSWSAFEIGGEGPEAPLERSTEGLALLARDEEGKLSPASGADIEAPRTLGELRAEVAAAAGADR